MPANWLPEQDFNGIRVEATPDGDQTQTTGDIYPVTKLSPTPYIVYVYADGRTSLDLRVELRLNNSIKSITTIAGIALTQGQIEQQDADLSQTGG